MTRRLALALALVLLEACYASGEAELVCEPEPAHFWRADEPFARGRIGACVACAEVRDLVASKGCGERLPIEVCTLTGACAYAEHAALLEEVRSSSCAGLHAYLIDPCVRPDPALYWREGGD